LVSTLAAVAAVQPAAAMPNFARKYEVSCTVCHTTIPRLNETGFQFRKAGFRMPDEIGNDTKVSMDQAFTARIQGRYDIKYKQTPSPTGTTKTTLNQVTLHEVTLYPLALSFGKYYGSLTELSVLSEDFVEIENAYFRYSRGQQKSWFSGRFGVMHPFEGYGASDRPYSINRPLIQRASANHNGDTFFTPWNFDEAGLELAYVYSRFSVSATLFNGLYLEDEGGSFKAFPAAGGALQKPANFDETNSKDFQLFVNQILRDDGSGVSAYFYTGGLDLPIPGAPSFSPATSFGNRYYRGALYADWRAVPRFELQGAFQLGQDHFYDTVAGNADATFTSEGFFAEADVPWNEWVTFGGRYDWFDPSTDKDDNLQSIVTVFANVPMNDGLQVIGEYQRSMRQQLALDDITDDNFQARLIWIW
jgi:hypothetical protein